RAFVVIVGTREPAETSCDGLIELPNAADPSHSVDTKDLGKQACFEPHTALQTLHEMTFVNEISRFAESVSARCQIERGGNGDKPPDLPGPRIAQLASHFLNNVCTPQQADAE